MISFDLFFFEKTFKFSQVPINFRGLKLHKRVTLDGDADGRLVTPQENCCYAGRTTFENVCLVLNGDYSNQLCTDAPWGWSCDDWET